MTSAHHAAIEIAEHHWRRKRGADGLFREHLTGRAGGSCRFLAGSYPEDFPDDFFAPDSFELVIERGFLQHFSEGPGLASILKRTRRLMKPHSVFYSLIAAREGAVGSWGPRRWTEGEIRRALGHYFHIVEMKKSVFTPGEAGSIPAWAVVMRPIQR